MAPAGVAAVFYKAPNTVVGPDDEILVPRTSAKTDWEVELAAVFNVLSRRAQPTCHRGPIRGAQCHQRTSRTTVKWR